MVEHLPSLEILKPKIKALPSEEKARTTQNLEEFARRENLALELATSSVELDCKAEEMDISSNG